MLHTEPRVAASHKPLGYFADYAAQERADLKYGQQLKGLQALLKRQPDIRPADPIPAPQTPPSR